MRVILNDKPTDVTQGDTISKLLERLKIDKKEIAIERNLGVVLKGDFDTTELREGDRIEIVRFVGGG